MICLHSNTSDAGIQAGGRAGPAGLCYNGEKSSAMGENDMRAYERLITYAQIWTTSDETTSDRSPSTDRQLDLARVLATQMRELGLADAAVDANGYVLGHLPASPGYEGKTRLGFIAHLDTAPDAPGQNVKPQIHPNYDGRALTLPSGLVLDPARFPDLAAMQGKTLITSDGSTLLGADDKAGIAEILTMVEDLNRNQIPHGPLSIAFTPDEEIGSGARLLDLDKFAADFAYTVDGGSNAEITYETFNAAQAHFDITGASVHPGSAKGLMVNAALVACAINAMLPAADIPALTEGYEGFFHLTNMSGTVEKARLDYIVRDHSSAAFQARLDLLRHIEKTINEQYGAGTVRLTIRHQYSNMAEVLEPHMHLVETAKAVIESLGLTPDTAPVRGGTDGAALSFRGLPCPNLGTGGQAFHGPYEHICAEDMDTQTAILTGIVRAYADRDRA